MRHLKLLSIVLTFIVVMSTTALVSVPALAENPWDGMKETDALVSVVSTTQFGYNSNGEYKGYIQTNQDAEFLAADYIKVTYTISGEFSDDTAVFTIQPFNAEWDGWQDNLVTIGGSALDGDTYTAYIAVADVKASLSDGSLFGINISFVEPNGYEATLTGYYYLAPESEETDYTAGDWLKKSIDYCDALDYSKYQTDSFNTFKSAVETARTVYNNASASDTAYQSARNALEKAKSKLLFADSTEASNPMEFRTLSASDTVYEMGVGWNLGNTLDGHTGMHPSETVWQSAITTKEMIKAIHDAGFNTIRVPVTWGDMIDDENGYAIDDAWMSRVQDIVDYCTELDMYTIINIHHDGVVSSGGWLGVGLDDIDSVYEKYECVWRNIAEKFKDYDEHLIFESANELTANENESDKNSDTVQDLDTPVIMNLNQIFVNVVRSTGSNNTKRWLAAVSHYANRGTGHGFALPEDSYNTGNRLMFAQHIYKATNLDTYSWTNANELVKVVKESHVKFGNNVPIILGEYGTKNRKYTSNPSGFNDIGRAYYFECATRAGQVALTVPCVWDQGCNTSNVYETGTYTVWNRSTNAPLFKTITDAMMRGMFLPATTQNKSYDMSDIVSDPEITEITKITPSTDDVVIEYGESSTVSAAVEPSNTNDVVLWKSEDDSIATVYRGIIQGNKIGTTYVTAFSQSGSAEERIKVTVLPRAAENPATSITTGQDSYTLIKGKYTNLNASSDNGETLIYSTSNDAVASVNRQGKIVAKSAGTTYVTVMAASGLTKTVPVTVTEASGERTLELAANVYYNDPNYVSNEVGVPITVSGDGQYTLTFDTATDLSTKAKAAGIKYLNNLTSIYIKDNDVTNGNAATSPLDSCEIRYDSIKVNDEPLTITNSGFKSAIKESGILDTNDPINSWDGSAVKEVSVSNHVLNFTTITNPTKIEIVFTLQNLKFTEEKPADQIPAETITASADKHVTMRPGKTVQIGVNVLPANTTSLISFISSNEGVVMVNDKGMSVDGSGSRTAEIIATGNGSATITAISDNGVSEVFEIEVKGFPFSSVEPLSENGTVTAVSANVNYIPDYETVTVIAAVYNQDGTLADAEQKEVSVSDITGNTLTVGGFNLNFEDGCTAKAFIWSGTDEIVPLGN